jgi:hypothetical protein
VIDFFPGSKGAVFSPDDEFVMLNARTGRFRYALWRIWSPARPPLMVIGLNPSRADETRDDHTIRRCVNFATTWGFGGLLMGNIFAFRSTYTSNLLMATDRIGPDNDLWLGRMRERAGMVLAAWGNTAVIDAERLGSIRNMFPSLHCLGVTQSGFPKHPARVRNDLQPIRWEVAA